MSALTMSRPVDSYGTQPTVTTFLLPVAAGVTIYPGALVVSNSSGFAQPATSALGLIAVGICIDQFPIVNSAGGNGAAFVQVRCGTFGFASATGADAITAATPIGTPLFAVDDQTVALTDGGGTRSFAGRFAGVNNNPQTAPGPYVTVNYYLAPTNTVQAATVSLTLAQLQAAGAVTSQAFNMGGILPTGAQVLGHSVASATGGNPGLDDATHATWNATIGGAAANDVVTTLNVSTGQTGFPKPGTSGTLGYTGAPQGGLQLALTVSSTVNLSTLTAGTLSASVLYTVPQ